MKDKKKDLPINTIHEGQNDFKICPYCKTPKSERYGKYARHLRNCDARLPINSDKKEQRNIQSSDTVHEGQKDAGTQIKKCDILVQVSGKNGFKYKSCGMIFSTSEGYNTHISKVHEGQNTIRPKTEISRVQKIYDNISASRRSTHLEVPKDELKKCPYCNIQIPVMVFSYDKHLQGCHKRLDSKFDSKIDPNLDSKSVVKNIKGQNEMLIVPNEKVFSCSQCKTTFPSRQEHLIKVHHIYKCVKCEQVFKTLKNLNDHIKLAEWIEIKNEYEEDENFLLFCTFCDSKFNTNDEFTVHLNSISHMQAKLKTKLEEYNNHEIKNHIMVVTETENILKSKQTKTEAEIIVGIGALINGKQVYFESTKSI